METNKEISSVLLWYVKQFKTGIAKNITTKYTVNYYESQVRVFTGLLQQQGLDDYKNLTMKYLLDLFEKDVEFDPKPIRSFLTFLFENDICNADFSFLVPKRKSHKRLPSFFTQEEINKVLSSIDRSNIIGRRNYLVMLLVSRLGLNSKQICNLKYSDIKDDVINVESTSGKTLLFPLTEEIREAFIEYYENNGQNKSPYIIFDQEECDARIYSSVPKIIKREFNKAGIKDERVIGVKAIRNSLIKKLREQGIEYSTITQGYDSSYKSIKRYQKIEYEILRECNLRIKVNTNEDFNSLLRGKNGIPEFY